VLGAVVGLEMVIVEKVPGNPDPFRIGPHGALARVQKFAKGHRSTRQVERAEQSTIDGHDQEPRDILDVDEFQRVCAVARTNVSSARLGAHEPDIEVRRVIALPLDWTWSHDGDPIAEIACNRCSLSALPRLYKGLGLSLGFMGLD
jgi:hypothetical protein